MTYHQDILYAKYYFVCRVGRYLKLKIVFRIVQYCKISSTYGSSVRNDGNKCRMNEKFDLNFKKKRHVASFRNTFLISISIYFLPTPEAKIRP